MKILAILENICMVFVVNKDKYQEKTLNSMFLDFVPIFFFNPF